MVYKFYKSCSSVRLKLSKYNTRVKFEERISFEVKLESRESEGAYVQPSSMHAWEGIKKLQLCHVQGTTMSKIHTYMYMGLWSLLNLPSRAYSY